MQFDLVTLLGIGAAIWAALLLRRHFSGQAAEEEDTRHVGIEQDVAQALKSKQKN